MAAPDPTTGAPVVLDSEAPATAVNLNNVANYAAEVGTRLIGTTAERTAYAYAREGLLWFDTTLDREYRHNGSGWVALPFVKFGRHTGATDANGFCVVTHGMGVTPSEVLATDRVFGSAQDTRLWRVQDIGPTTFAVRYYNAGAPFGVNTVEFSWAAFA